MKQGGNDGKKGNHGKQAVHDSHESHSSHQQESIIPPRGDYRTLLSYQKSDVIYQITYRFSERFLRKGDRTIDQMVQAARSGKQNIVEGSKAATTSREMEIKLTNVARASLEELRRTTATICGPGTFAYGTSRAAKLRMRASWG